MVCAAVLISMGCSTSTIKSESRAPNQVTGDFGKSRMYVRYNILSEVRNKNSNKFLRSQSIQISPCAMGFVDLIYNPEHKSGGSCTGYTFNGLKDKELSGSLLGVKVNVTHNQNSFNSELIIGSDNTAYTIVKRLEDSVKLDSPFYHRFVGKINLGTSENLDEIYNYTLDSVEIANSHYYEAGAQANTYEQVDFSKIAQNYVDSRGGIEKFADQTLNTNTDDLLKLVTAESKDLNKRFKNLKSFKKVLDNSQYEQLKNSYTSFKNEIDKTWDRLISENPAFASKRIKIKTDE